MNEEKPLIGRLVVAVPSDVSLFFSFVRRNYIANTFAVSGGHECRTCADITPTVFCEIKMNLKRTL